MSQDLPDLHTADRLDVGPANRLTIRHDSECFEHGTGERNVTLHPAYTFKPRPVLGAGQQLITTGNLFDIKELPFSRSIWANR